MTQEYNSRCMCTFCKLNKTVTNKINWIVTKEVRPRKKDMRREGAIRRHHQKIREEIMARHPAYSKSF